ncbi:MAG: AarF/UbiB family protein, partial [Spirochaetota bacterium]
MKHSQQSQSKSEKDNNLFTYKNKSTFSRFWIVYKFYLRNLFRLLWHFKILKNILSEDIWEARETALYDVLGLECNVLFLRLGGVYVKLGQFLSNLNHVLPLNFTSQLQNLQDKLPPHSFIEIKQRIEDEFGEPVEKVFPGIEEKPIAAASTAQVHIVYIEKKKLAVKILYPGIEKIVAKDLKTVYFIMKRINRYLFSFDYRKIFKEIDVVITREMDLSQEAHSLTKMKNLFKTEKNII